MPAQAAENPVFEKNDVTLPLDEFPIDKQRHRKKSRKGVPRGGAPERQNEKDKAQNFTQYETKASNAAYFDSLSSPRHVHTSGQQPPTENMKAAEMGNRRSSSRRRQPVDPTMNV